MAMSIGEGVASIASINVNGMAKKYVAWRNQRKPGIETNRRDSAAAAWRRRLAVISACSVGVSNGGENGAMPAVQPGGPAVAAASAS